jgi:hypothetical protein
MKFAALFITSFLTMTAFGNPAKSVHTRIIGRVLIDKQYTITCMSTNCPKSLPYFQLVLDDAQIDGVGPVENVFFSDFERIFEVQEKPDYLVYAGVSLTEGLYVIIESDVFLNQIGNRLYATALNPVKVKLAPARYPGILY